MLLNQFPLSIVTYFFADGHKARYALLEPSNSVPNHLIEDILSTLNVEQTYKIGDILFYQIRKDILDIHEKIHGKKVKYRIDGYTNIAHDGKLKLEYDIVPGTTTYIPY